LISIAVEALLGNATYRNAAKHQENSRVLIVIAIILNSIDQQINTAQIWLQTILKASHMDSI